MKPIAIEFSDNSRTAKYIQLYDYLKQNITEGAMEAGERLPSLRRLAADLSVSVTTIQQAYEQLSVEGYIQNRPQSGYYVAALAAGGAQGLGVATGKMAPPPETFENLTEQRATYRYDTTSFDFVKWKKCFARVLNERPELLLFESDPQGEYALRHEIARYVYTARGVTCRPEQIVIAAGTQQLTNHLIRVMNRMQIHHVSTEDPGYLPVQNIFRDHGFSMAKIPVKEDGIAIERLPMNISSAVYVSPSNQFPTGSVMPIGRRYQLLEWAKYNRSIILEDDYDSELRYFGKPVPALASLDQDGRVVYFGSFSSTLFPAIKISYMILPPALAEIFGHIKNDYDQTCSKEEQLTLAMFMEKGYYYTNIRKLRSLYAQKLQAVLQALQQYAPTTVLPQNTRSGINITLQVTSSLPPEELCARAKSLSLQVAPVASLTEQNQSTGSTELIFYYNQIPLADIAQAVADLVATWELAK